jgi:hypothetical protein
MGRLAKPLGLGAVLLLAVAAGFMLPHSFTGFLTSLSFLPEVVIAPAISLLIGLPADFSAVLPQGRSRGRL